MSEETKRLLKYDMRSVFKDMWVFVLIIIGLWLWCYLIYDTMANAVLLICFVDFGLRDWQIQIRMYVSAGMSRKGIFQVLNIRNAAIFLGGLFIEAVVAFVAYPVFKTKFFIISGAYLLFIWGFGQITGVLVYHRKSWAQFSLGNEASGFWRVLFDGITTTTVSVMGIAAVAVLAGGICFARKHMKEYMVY